MFNYVQYELRIILGNYQAQLIARMFVIVLG
jgi:hypothetical protein